MKPKGTKKAPIISKAKAEEDRERKSKNGKEKVRDKREERRRRIRVSFLFYRLQKERMMQPHRQASELQQAVTDQPSVGQISGTVSFNNILTAEDEEISKSALSTFRAKEDEIEKKKLEVRERVQLQIGRIEEETRRLATIREELEGLSDPMKKEVSVVRKRIDAVNKELKPLGQACQKKEREYKEALASFNDKNKEKVQLISRLMELVSENEKTTMKKLEELSKSIES